MTWRSPSTEAELRSEPARLASNAHLTLGATPKPQNLSKKVTVKKR